MQPKFNLALDKGAYRTRFTLGRSLKTHYFGTSDRATAYALASLMRSDWQLNRFDTTLERYKASTHQLAAQAPTAPQSEHTVKPTITECWEHYQESLDEVKGKHTEVYRMLRRYALMWPWDDTQWFLELKPTYAASTWNPRRTWLKTCINHCLTTGFISGSNPYEHLSPSKKGNSDDKIKPFSKSEISRILDALEHNTFCANPTGYPHSRYVPFVKFLFITGVRIGEAVALQWEDINWDDQLITISRTYSKSAYDSRRKLKETKTGIIRHIPLNSELRELFQSIKYNHFWLEDEFVFKGFKAPTINPDNFRARVWKPVLEQLNIEYRYPYQTRHTVLSEVAKTQGLMAAAKLAGHSSTDMVSRHYARYTDTVELPKLQDD